METRKYEGLILQVRRGTSVRQDFEAFSRTPPGESLSVTGLGAAWRYAQRTHTKLAPIFGELCTDLVLECGTGTPSADPDSGLHYLPLADPRDADELVSRLRASDHIEYVDPVAGAQPLKSAVPKSRARRQRFPKQWALGFCQFPRVWETLDDANAPDPIAIIDDGGPINHVRLQNRVEYVDLTASGSRAWHAQSVAGIISATRDAPGMAGCCSARVRVFNVFTDHPAPGEGRMSWVAFVKALKTIVASEARVLNLSIADQYYCRPVAELIKRGAARNMVTVAAMGRPNHAQYPAKYQEAVGVGANDWWGNRTSNSMVDDHVFLTAPGVRILTLVGKSDFQELSGTSFAAPMVSAAVWLMLRRRPDLTVCDVKDLLQRSARRSRQQHRDLRRKGLLSRKVSEGAHHQDGEHGWGQLNLVRLEKQLHS